MVKIKLRIFKLAAVMAGVGLMLLLLEASIRLLQGRCNQVSDVLYYYHLPNSHCREITKEFRVTYSYNSLGARGKEVEAQKSSQVYRILVLGDSFTQGVGVKNEQTFSSLLEEALNKISQSRVEVVNAGTAAYSPLLHYLYLKNKGLKLEPDLVLLNFNTTDFFEDNRYYQLSYTDKRGNVIGVRNPDFVIRPGWEQILFDHIYLYGFLKERVPRWYKSLLYVKAGWQSSIKNWWLGGKLEPSEEFKQDTLKLERKGKFYFVDEHANENVWQLPRRNILLIRDLLQERGIPVIIIHQPLGQEVNSREVGWQRRYYNQGEKIFHQRLFEEMTDFCEQEQLTCLNLLPKFRQADRFPLYYPRDGHWTRLGHQVAAQAIYDFLLENKLIPEANTQ